MTNSIYYIDNNLFVNGMLPLTKRTPINIALLESVNIGMQYTNQNLCEYIFGSSYSYFDNTTTYSVGQRVNGGLQYQNSVYQFIGGTATTGNILASTISSQGISYSIGDTFVVQGGNPFAIGIINSVGASPSYAVTKYTLLTTGNGYLLGTYSTQKTLCLL